MKKSIKEKSIEKVTVAEEVSTRRSGLAIMGRLIGLVRPMLPIMFSAIVLGVLGYLSAIFLTILAAQGLLRGLFQQGLLANQFLTNGLPIDGFAIGQASIKSLFLLMGILAVLRGILHYAEQYCNHYIAFKLLAIIRHKVFAVLRKLCPAKLEGRDKGNLISVITTDIELLEVFYAHTISPIAIAVLTSLVMVFFVGRYHAAAGILALIAYILVGAVIPLWNGRRGGKKGMAFRNEFGELNSFVLDSLRGLDETLQYGQGEKRKEEMNKRSRHLGGVQRELSKLEGEQASFTNLVILFCSFAMLFLTLYLYQNGKMDFSGALTSTVAMMGSFGPVAALSSLSNNLNQTLASGERVLSLLEESPMVEEIPEVAEETGHSDAEKANQEWNGVKNFSGAEVSHVTFSYEEETILRDYSLQIPKGKIIGIQGASGSGKSTLLKLLMRFWETGQGEIQISDWDINRIPTKQLRDAESYVTQETHLFHDSIANNIAVGKQGATREEIVEAAKKASLHEFVMTLPQGYDTEVGELGDTLSGGERQRIGIARAFLHDAPFLLLDEPTSNLDSLNEGIILKSLGESCGEKTVVLVSHRKSTMNMVDVLFQMENGRSS